MSMYASQIDQLRRDLARLHGRAASASKTAADERKKAADYRGRAARSNSAAYYVRQAETAESRALKADQARASIEKDIATKQKRLYDAEAAADRERARVEAARTRSFETRLRDTYRPPALIYPSAVPQAALPGNRAPEVPLATPTDPEWDFFVSHASPDKSFVRPLTVALRERGARVWFDEFDLTVGDSLRTKIDEGLSKSKYGIVVLTQSYLEGRRWTDNELNGLFAANKRILPIWHKVSYDEVARYGPMLADRVALATAVFSVTKIVDELMKLIEEPPAEETQAS